MGDLSELKTGKIRLQQSNDRLVSTPTKELRIVVEKCSAVTPVKLGPPPQEHSDEEQEQGMDVESDNEQPQEVTEEEIPVEISKVKQVPVIGRISQLQQLNIAIPDRSVTGLPGALFLWGAPATGKSFALDSVLEKKDVHVIKIHSSEILCGRRAFFETFVKQLVRIDHKLDEKFRCDSLRLLYSNVYEYLQEKSLRVVAVIEGAETLRGEHDDILRMLISLQDITQCQICTVLISTLPPGQFMPNILDHSIIPIFFPQYTMEELNSIIVEHISPRCTSSKSSNSCEFFVKMIVSMFYYICRDLRKLLRLAVSHWDSFQQLIDTSQEVNLTRLWKKLEPQMKAQFFQLNSSVTAINSSSSRDQENTHKTLEMPMNAKYLLIASYLATHNPPSSDKRFFVKSKINKAKKSRLTQTLKTDTSKPSMRSFELNRLHAIFGSIQLYCDDKAMNKNRNISFMTLLTSLCQNKLVQHLGEDSWGNHKYKCLLDYDTVLEISRSVNFELNNYLHRLL